jgi:hypothetical protein
MFGLPFPTWLGWWLGPGIMIATFCTSLGLYKKYLKKEKEENQQKGNNESCK